MKDEKKVEWEAGIEDVAYIVHLWMHATVYQKPCHLCARYPLPKDVETNVQYENRGYSDAEIVDGGAF